jgi:two-component system LytT family response regulator
MIDALRRQDFDFIHKPTSREDLSQVMTRYYEAKRPSMKNSMQENISNTQHVIVVNALNEHTVLRFDDIAFFRFDSVRRIWEVITINNTTHQLRHRTTADTILAYSKKFVQIHKAYIVNVHQISEVLDNQCLLRPPLDDIKELRISKNYRHDFMAAFYSM